VISAYVCYAIPSHLLINSKCGKKQAARDFLQLFDSSGRWFQYFLVHTVSASGSSGKLFNNLPIEPINRHIADHLNKIPVRKIQTLSAGYPSNAQLLAIREALPVLSLPLEPCKRQVHYKNDLRIYRQVRCNCVAYIGKDHRKSWFYQI